MPPPILNTQTAAVVDAVLTNYARGYRNADMISHLLFPRVPVPKRSIRLIKFGKESFRRLNTRRAPGSARARIQYGYASDPVALAQDSLEAVVPTEHLDEAADITDLAANSIRTIMDVLDLGLECEVADMVRNTASYAADHKINLAGSDRWGSDTSDPLDDVEAGIDVIRKYTGRRPNVAILGPSAFNAAKKHPKIVENFKYTSSKSITTDMLAGYFNLSSVIVGNAVYLPDGVEDETPAVDVWGNDVVLAYVPAAGNYQVPSFGYTYELNGFPQVNVPYFENPTSSWIYPMTVERRPYIVGADAGYLIQNAGAAPA